MDDVILNKTASIERCLQRIEAEYLGSEQEFEINFTKQDAIILNLLRACEQSIDLANHLLKIKQLGLPQSSRESFDLLQQHQILPEKLAGSMKGMVGFRNIATHEYQKLKLEVVKNIIEKHLQDFKDFSKIALSQIKS